jgi:hypothetical protein
MLTWSTFVLQRRVNQPFGAVGRIVCDPWLLARGTRIDLTGEAVLRLEEPFGVTFPMFGLDGASWRAPATICTRDGRQRENVEIELNPWDEQATELVVRPRARSPYNWRAHHVRRYFRLAHEAADALTRVLATDTPRLEPAEPPPVYTDAQAARTPRRRASSRG